MSHTIIRSINRPIAAGAKSGGGRDIVVWLSRFAVAGATDSTSALNAFGSYARSFEGQSAQIWLNVAAGVYEFDQLLAFTALEGITELNITGYGNPSFQNIRTFGVPWLPDCFPNLHSGAGAVVELIDSVAAGSESVVLKTPANAASYPVGASAVVMSEDIQISSSNFSYPPNCNNFDYVQITSVNSTTGVITFTPPLAYSHSENNIDGPSANTHPCGKARIWLLDTPSTTPTKWNVKHVYKNFTVLESVAPILDYIGMGGKHIEWNGCTVPGISPTTAYRVNVINTVINGPMGNANEPDKLVKYLLVEGSLSSQSLTFQSSSIDSVIIRSCTINVFLGSGTPKNILIEDCILPIYGEGIAGSKFGHNLVTTLRNCTISAWAPFLFVGIPFVLGGANLVTIDGVNITYAAGIITVPNTTTDLADWNVVPNVTHLNLATTSSNYFTGDIGTALVTSLTEDANNIYYHVNGWPAALPAYASGGVYISRNGPIYCYNLTGCDISTQVTAATAAGKFPWQLFIKTYVEADGVSGSWGYMVGDFLSITVVVTNPIVLPGNIWQMATNLVDGTTMLGSQQLLINIDTNVAGTRVFTQAGLTGKVGNDDVLLAGVPQATLPVGKWAQTIPSWAYANGLLPSPRTLSIAVSAEFNPGSDFRKAGP